jgi:hypothetical protein
MTTQHANYSPSGTVIARACSMSQRHGRLDVHPIEGFWLLLGVTPMSDEQAITVGSHSGWVSQQYRWSMVVPPTGFEPAPLPF